MIAVVAMKEEIRLLPKDYTGKCIITGAGAVNVIEALRDIDRETQILNVGYAGSNTLPVGTKATIGKSKMYHPNVEISENEYDLGGGITCYTSNDFVLSTEIKEPCVFDMELAFIMALGFKNVVSEKTVSDNLSLDEFEKHKNR